MVLASRFLVALAVTGLLSTSLYADVIPSRRAQSSEDPGKVQARLMELGVAKDSAVAQTQQLTANEAAYFSQHPERVQFVGQEPFGGQTDLLWWEWVFGIAALVGPVVWILVAK